MIIYTYHRQLRGKVNIASRGEQCLQRPNLHRNTCYALNNKQVDCANCIYESAYQY